MKYDDASWHYGGDFPEDLPSEAGATHIGMFVAWCKLNELGGDLHIEDFPEFLDKLKARKMTPTAWFMSACDEKFTDEDLGDEGNSFAAYYYAADEAPYIGDYEDTLGKKVESLYYVPDSWDSYDALSPIIKERFEAWKLND